MDYPAQISSQGRLAEETFDIDDPLIRSSKPKILIKARVPVILLTFADVLFFVATPIFFVLLGVAAITLHQEPTKDNHFGTQVEAITRLGPTIIPILFAAIAAQGLRLIGRFKAERGITLGSLELLIGSRSVWSAFESQVRMRRVDVVGGLLLALWAMSPIGGQASLRLLSKYDSAKNSTFSLRYLDTGPAAAFWPDTGFGRRGLSNEGLVNTLYSASFLSPDNIKMGSQDTWGNVKIPRLESLDSSNQDDNGWIAVSSIPTVESYSSLVGLPVVGRPSDASTTFHLESSYFSLLCTPPVQSSTDAPAFWSQTVGQAWSSILAIGAENPLRTGEKDANHDLTFFL